MITYDQNVDDYDDDDDCDDDNDVRGQMMIMTDECQLCDMTLSTITLMTIERSSVRLEVAQDMHSM